MATPNQIKDFEELKSWIEQGWYDNFIPELIELLKNQSVNSYQIGSKVVINNLASNSNSKYKLNGSEAVVQKINAKSVVVKITKLSDVAKKNKVATVGGVWQLSPQMVVAI
jgi:hypothetical protein